MEKYKKILYTLGFILILVFGIFLRTKLYIINDVFSDDECRLVLSLMNKTLFGSLFFLGNAQSAPPVFVFFSKIIFYIAGYKEIAAKFIPYAASIASVFLFYRVCCLYLKKSCSAIIALFLFAICQPLISFSSIFKQYSTDVFISVLCLYLLPQIKIKELSKWRFAGVTAGIILLPLISLPSLFFIGAFFIQSFIDNFRDKSFYKRFVILVLPFVLMMVGYYILNLAPAQADMEKYFPNYWVDGFWRFSLPDLIRLLVINIKFYFVPNDLTLPAIILLVWGICDYLRERKTEYNFILWVIVLVLFASLCNLYPLSGRIGLYFIPVILLLLMKPLDSKKTAAAILAFILVLTGFCRYNFRYLKNISGGEYFIIYSPKLLMHKMTERFKPNDIIICNSASTPSYMFYSSAMDFYPENVYEMSLSAIDKESVLKYLNGLEKGHRYWFYLVKDYNQAKIFPFIFEWLEGKNVLYKFSHRDSYLFYLEY